MISSEVQRTLVKSPPELWAELSDPAALARHLGELGEIRITKIEPEQSVEWEAEAASGKVELKASGWGTKVTLSVTQELAEKMSATEPEPEPEPEPAEEPVEETAAQEEQAPRVGFFARLFRRRAKTAAAGIAEPEPVAIEPEPDPEPPADLSAELAAAEEALAAETTEMLKLALDRLGAAHHRPFSRG